MKFSFAKSLSVREAADLIILPFWEGAERSAEPAAEIGLFRDLPVLKTGDFRGKAGETALTYIQGEKEPRALLLGLGKLKGCTVESLRRSFSAAIRIAQSKKLKAINILFPVCKQKEEFLRGIGEGVLLTNYAYTEYKNSTLKDQPMVLVEKVQFIGIQKAPLLERLQTINSGVAFVRDLVNRNADDKTAEVIAQIAKSFEKQYPKLKTTIFDRKRLEKEGMGLILAVNRASMTEPCLVQLSYQGNPSSQEHVVFVGKGITYDTGGYTLKPTDGMMTMKSDMAGAATAIGAVMTAAALKLKVNVTAVAPLTENSIGPKSFKLGDVYKSYLGKTVEINNTDAEGRLVLADALAYTVKNLKPTCILDLATLTGAIIIALGEEYTGIFTKDDKIADDLLFSSQRTGELVWRMPFHEDYKEALKSDIADLINTGGRDASSIKAALFLHHFVGDDIPWAHLDIAGPAFLTKPKYYNTTKATGYGVRLLIEFLEKRFNLRS